MKTIAQDYMRGFFGTMDALLAVGLSAETGAPQELTSDYLKEALGRFPIAMRGVVEDGGMVMVLMSAKDSLYFAKTVMGEEGPAEATSVGEEAMPEVREVLDPCLGGGCGALKETFGRELAFKDVKITEEGPDGAAGLLAELGPAYGGGFSYSASTDLSGEGAVLVASSLMALLPESEQAEARGGAEISQDEVGDILGGFSPEEGGGEAPPNIEMVLDIRLVCTARLGRVEMPIGNILDLGPGSIVEVGHLVDEPVELLVNDKLIARGDVVVVDEKFGLRITEIVSPEERIKSLR
jgi:flagellar motor switch protein FliN/FliY